MPPRLPVIVLLFVGAGTAVRAQNDWVIDRLAIQYDIQPDGSVLAMDTVDADFSLSAHHGIYRDFVVRQGYEPDPSKYREYDISLQDVTSSDVRHPKVETQHNGALLRFKIGDPNKTITGRESVPDPLPAAARHEPICGSRRAVLERDRHLAGADRQCVGRRPCAQVGDQPCRMFRRPVRIAGEVRGIVHGR